MKSQNLILILIGIVCLGLFPKAHAVNPAPDGGYPGGNTAEGQDALVILTTGTYNTAIGLFSLLSNTEGKFNTAVGAGTLLANMGDPSSGEGVENTATGAGALLSNNTGSSNTANGAFALFSNTTGADNTATGQFALVFNTTGDANTAIGDSALYSNTIGFGNTAIGPDALSGNTTGNDNTVTGLAALITNTIGSGNTANGYHALFISTGSGNIALGAEAGSNLTFGDNNIYLGSLGVATESNTIRIGTSGVQTSAFIRGIRGVTTGNNDAIPVLIDTAGQLGTTSSSRRYKKEIKPMDQTSEAILALKPVTFHYKSDKTGTAQFGLIAEEVAEVNPNLVVRDENGEIYTVRYDAVNAMFLNEFLKEHKKVEQQVREIQEQRTTISELKKSMETVIAHLKKQDSKIQKVSDQIEINKFATGRIRRGGAEPRMVRNDSRKVESNTSSQREKRKKDS
jgi:Chaperone of endosialidase